MFDSLDDFFSHIKQLHQLRTELSLDRITEVAQRLQLTQFTCPVIAIAGTNGKGSIAKTLETTYFHAGFKTALYTSPHLIEFNERIRINHHHISDDDLLLAFQFVESGRGNVILSFFEYITLAALYLFQEAKCDVIILEVGLGGRFDAVNCVENDIAVIASIGFDHMNLLGNTRESIGYEKACIARENKWLICGDENPPKTIAQTVRDKKGKLFQINQDYFYTISDNFFECHGKTFNYRQLPKPHLKAQNIATAIAVIELLQNKLPIVESDIATGILKTTWQGRFEKIISPLPCVLDVAHNQPAAEWLAMQYQLLQPVKNTIAIVGMLKDKAMIETVGELLSCADTWFVCNLESETDRGADGSSIAAFLKSCGKSSKTFASVTDAMYSLDQAYSQKKCDRALIFGSFYTVAAAKQWLLKKEKEQCKKK
jgi:dihydrofolate synthase/folylpolyglutamate synthase